MSFTEKVDVLDLIINILQEHEQKLDELVTRLEALVLEPKKDPERESIGREDPRRMAQEARYPTERR
ncbi:MAG: hypothetical protein NWE89_05230 [Candidatus Bathyarchaeota archaeon]|nr:hypothetical protein [Candidatus Bathyarchaeota archaeon]